jgi:hypothetical protein
LKPPCVQRDTVCARGTPNYNALKQTSLSSFLRSSFAHPSFILRSSFVLPFSERRYVLRHLLRLFALRVTLPDKSEAETVILSVSMPLFSRAAVQIRL